MEIGSSCCQEQCIDLIFFVILAVQIGMGPPYGHMGGGGGDYHGYHGYGGYHGGYHTGGYSGYLGGYGGYHSGYGGYGGYHQNVIYPEQPSGKHPTENCHSAEKIGAR